MAGWTPHIVGIGGTTRPGSTTEAALRQALACAAEAGARTSLFAGTALDLPHFDPGVPERTEAARALVAALDAADGVILASPGYHGSVSGLVKNALDYVEDLREAPRPYLSGRAVGIVVCADGVQALGATLATLRGVTHALRGWPTPYAALVRAGDKPFAADGSCRDPGVTEALRTVAREVTGFARMARGAEL